MLKERVITACVLALGLAVVLLALPYRGFVFVVSLVFTLAAWEWANLAGLTLPWQRFVYASALAALFWGLGIVDWQQASGWAIAVLSVSVLCWLLALHAVWRYPDQLVTGFSRQCLLLLAGVWLLFPAWLGLVLLQPAAAGSGLIWLVITSIAAADIGAYFAGRRFGRRKLAVHVSPGKTWEGFWGGALASALFAVVVAVVLDLSALRFVGFVMVMALTSAASVLGDLFESMVKRERGIKDSSHLLPGHGGVLDRIDGWTAAVPLFTLCYLLVGH